MIWTLERPTANSTTCFPPTEGKNGGLCATPSNRYMAQKGPFLENWLRSWDGGAIRNAAAPTAACLPLRTAPRPSWLCPAGGTGRGKATGCLGGLHFCIVSSVFVNGAKRQGHADCYCPVQAQRAGSTWLAVHSPPKCAKSKHCSVQSTSCEMPPPPRKRPALCLCPPSKLLWEGPPGQAARGSGSVSGHSLEAAQRPRCQLLAPTQPSTVLGKVPPLPT